MSACLETVEFLFSKSQEAGILRMSLCQVFAQVCALQWETEPQVWDCDSVLQFNALTPALCQQGSPTTFCTAARVGGVCSVACLILCVVTVNQDGVRSKALLLSYFFMMSGLGAQRKYNIK